MKTVYEQQLETLLRKIASESSHYRVEIEALLGPETLMDTLKRFKLTYKDKLNGDRSKHTNKFRIDQQIKSKLGEQYGYIIGIYNQTMRPHSFRGKYAIVWVDLQGNNHFISAHTDLELEEVR